MAKLLDVVKDTKRLRSLFAVRWHVVQKKFQLCVWGKTWNHLPLLLGDSLHKHCSLPQSSSSAHLFSQHNPLIKSSGPLIIRNMNLEHERGYERTCCSLKGKVRIWTSLWKRHDYEVPRIPCPLPLCNSWAEPSGRMALRRGSLASP
jgi:hypothetical protein